MADLYVGPRFGFTRDHRGPKQVYPYTDSQTALEATSISTSKITERTHGDISVESDSICARENMEKNRRRGGIPV